MKKISTKIYISMFALTVLILAFVGAALILNMTLDYYRSFERSMTLVFDKELPEDTNKLFEYVENKSDILNQGSVKDVFIFEDGNIVKSTKTGGIIKMTSNLEKVLAGGRSDKPSLTLDALDYAVRVSDSTVLYVLDSKDELYADIRDISFLFVQVLILGILIAALLAYFISKRLTYSINKLTDGAKRMSDGEFVTVDVTSSDEIGNLCAVFNDMSRQIQNDFDEFERVERSRREFVANVSHELKTPLTVIKSYSETLNTMEVDADTQKKFLSVIADETDHMTNIVGQLLIASGLETPADAARTHIQLNTVCNNIFDSLVFETGKKNITVSVAGTASVMSDMQKVTTILSNLITNAIKYTEADGNITVTVTDGDRPRVDVLDNGIGIAPDDLPHVFERFYRADKARNRKTGGSGLGLAIAKECADAIGANLTVESVLHEYTKFSLEF